MLCVKCGKDLDREGSYCVDCLRKSRLRQLVRSSLDGKRFTKWKNELSKEEYDKIYDKIMKEILEEEKEFEEQNG